MIGREYSKHLDILIQSFREMNNQYKKKVKKHIHSPFINFFIEIYISVFGIPEIGLQIRSMYFEKIISSYLLNKNPKTILDAGSGIGVYTFWLGKKFYHAKVIGGDIDVLKLHSSRIILKELRITNVKFVNLDITKNKKKTKYDFIINIDVLEHVENFLTVLNFFYDELNKDGYLYVHVPQPHLERFFSQFKNWHHKAHVNNGISKLDLERYLKNLNFKIIASKETFGFFGKLTWELNHMMLSRNFFLAGLTFPFLYILALADLLMKNKHGLGIAILAQK